MLLSFNCINFLKHLQLVIFTIAPMIKSSAVYIETTQQSLSAYFPYKLPKALKDTFCGDFKMI